MVDPKSAALVGQMLSHLKSDLIDTEQTSRIAKLYAGRSVFITGATGFIGKLLVEKLLRSCPDIRKIYLLIRKKRDQDAGRRLQDLIQSQLFDRIRSAPSGLEMLEQKLHAIPGDITMENFGICADDMRLLRDQVSIVFNSAASVSFVEPIDAAVRNNIYSVSQLVGVCNQLANLEALVHLSTAYSNCNKRDTIHEIFYEPPMSGDQILRAVRELRQLQDSLHVHPSIGLDDRSSSGELEPTRDACDPQTFYEPRHETADKGSQNVSADLLDEFTRIALRRSNRPNSYTFTKAIAECYLLELVGRAPDRYLGERGVPVAIVRPSIVGAAWREPEVGFVDNFNGCTAGILSLYTGALQAFPGCGHLVGDLVPVDMVANMIIATGHFLACPAVERLDRIEPDRGVYIFNFVSGNRNPLLWRQVTDVTREVADKYPSKHQVRLCGSYFVRAKLFGVYDYLNHFVPAKLQESLLRHVMRKRLTKRTSPLAAYDRIKRMTDTLTPFTSNRWLFEDKNVETLCGALDDVDKQLFPFDIRQIDWTTYLRNYTLGARLYALRDEPRSVTQALRSLKRRQLAYRSSLVMLAILFYCFIFHSSYSTT